MEWNILDVSKTELSLHTTLKSGQSFRWKEIESNTYRGVLGSNIVTLKQEENQILFKSQPPCPDMKNKLTDYFQLDHSLSDLYKQWSGPSTISDSHKNLSEDFAKTSIKISGLRLLRQDPLECTFSFICSQNNNIPRITLMISKLCKKYGNLIGTVDEEEYHCFPTLEKLTTATEPQLKELGFGYRAKYVVSSVMQVLEKGGRDWLNSLREKDNSDVQKELLSLTGVGPKVCDCISLFSLDKFSLVPVDTHVFQIAQRYLPSLKDSKPSKKNQLLISSLFTETFGPFAGWAHTILFAAELSTFKGKKKNNKTKSTKENKTPTKTKKSKQSKTRTPLKEKRKREPSKNNKSIKKKKV